MSNSPSRISVAPIDARIPFTPSNFTAFSAERRCSSTAASSARVSFPLSSRMNSSPPSLPATLMRFVKSHFDVCRSFPHSFSMSSADFMVLPVVCITLSPIWCPSLSFICLKPSKSTRHRTLNSPPHFLRIASEIEKNLPLFRSPVSESKLDFTSSSCCIWRFLWRSSNWLILVRWNM